jgi:hypothetical protein
MVPRNLFDHFVMELDHRLAHDFEYRRSRRREVIVAPPPWPSASLRFTSQPSVAFHSLQQRIQRPRADVIAVASKLA